jgi:MFS family permease
VLLYINVPGGAPIPATPLEGRHWGNMAAALHDRNFAAYLGGMAGQTIGAAMVISFLPLYLRERIGLESSIIVRLDIAAMVGGALASLGWGWLSDRVGSRPVLMPACGLSLLDPLGWVLLPVTSPQLIPLCAVLYFVTGVAANGVAIGSGRLLYNGVIPAQQSTAYNAIYYAWLGLTGGIAPLLASALLSAGGYPPLFLAALAFLGAGGLLYQRVRPDDRHTTRTAVRSFLDRIAER